MSIKPLILSTFLFCTLFSGAQELKVPIKFIVSNAHKSKRLSSADVSISFGSDTLAKLKTNSKGICDTTLILKFNEEYKCSLRKEGYYPSSTKIIVDTNQSYIVEFSMLEMFIERRSVFPIYEHNQVDMIPESKDTMFPKLFKELEIEKYCLEFTYNEAKNESKRIARRRIKNFRVFLESGGINGDNYYILIQPMFYIENDCRARIEGRIMAMESDCENIQR